MCFKKRREIIRGSKTALVTGASTGIGRCYAQQLAGLGYNLILVGLHEEALNELAAELAAAEGVSVRVVVRDLATADAAHWLHGWVHEQGLAVDVLINNAGIFSFCDIVKTPVERIERTVLLHNMTVALMCRLFAADMTERGTGGHILNMSSFSIYMPFPGLSLYSASKAFIKSFSVAFSKEVSDCGIKVTAVCPAGIATDLYGLTKKWQKIGLKLGALSTPEMCARRGLRALWRGRRCIVPDWWNRIFIPFCLALPPFAMRWLRGVTMRFQK